MGRYQRFLFAAAVVTAAFSLVQLCAMAEGLCEKSQPYDTHCDDCIRTLPLFGPWIKCVDTGGFECVSTNEKRQCYSDRGICMGPREIWDTSSTCNGAPDATDDNCISTRTFDWAWDTPNEELNCP